jgi:PmbA protein
MPSEHHCISKGKDLEKFDSHLGDQKLETITPKEVYEIADRVVAEARKDSRVTIDRVEVSWNKSSRTLLNSNGIIQGESQNSLSFFVMGMAKQGEEVTSFDYDGSTLCKFQDIESAITQSIGQFRESVITSLGVRSGKTYTGPVLFHPSAVSSLIASFIASNCNGISQQDGMSAWKDKLGEQIGSEQITLTEDPLDETRVQGWHRFDREGVPTRRHELIKAGKLNFVAHNCFSAHRGKTQPTGNASGGARALPSIGVSNLVLQTGTKYKTDEGLFGDFGSGLLLRRFSGRTDPFSGVFSGVAKNSHWIENGNIAFPLNQVMVSGNLFEVLKKILAIGPRLHTDIGGGAFPYVIVDGLSVTAG